MSAFSGTSTEISTLITTIKELFDVTPGTWITDTVDFELKEGAEPVSWDPERSESVISTAGIPVEEALADIGIKTRNVVINMECDGEASCVKLLGEVRPTQIVD